MTTSGAPLNVPPELLRLQEQYNSLLAAYEAGQLDYDDALASIAALSVIDGSGQLWTFSQEGKLMVGPPGGQPVPGNEVNFISRSAPSPWQSAPVIDHSAGQSPQPFPWQHSETADPDTLMSDVTWTPAQAQVPLPIRNSDKESRPSISGRGLPRVNRPSGRVGTVAVVVFMCILVSLGLALARNVQNQGPEVAASSNPPLSAPSSATTPSAASTSAFEVKISALQARLTSGDGKQFCSSIVAACPSGPAQVIATLLRPMMDGQDVRLVISAGSIGPGELKFVDGSGRVLLSKQVTVVAAGEGLKLAKWPSLP